VDGEIFFQQKPPARTPAGVRVEAIPAPEESGVGAERIVGGDLTTLLYTIQLGCVSVDPWFSRVGRIEYPDYAILDLDPGPKAGFQGVIQAARLVRAELDRLGLAAALKSSGSRGLHIALPLPRRTSYAESLALAERIAKRVASAHPDAATVERSLADRPAAAVYIDYLQNARGKSVASAYCARVKAGATVSTPLEWSELRDALDPGAFTIRSVPARVAAVGDIWSAAMKRANPRRVVESVIAKG
jgi:bifunctional non-homologous end joining protein LigD